MTSSSSTMPSWLIQPSTTSLIDAPATGTTNNPSVTSSTIAPSSSPSLPSWLVSSTTSPSTFTSAAAAAAPPITDDSTPSWLRSMSVTKPAPIVEAISTTTVAPLRKDEEETKRPDEEINSKQEEQSQPQVSTIVAVVENEVTPPSLPIHDQQPKRSSLDRPHSTQRKSSILSVTSEDADEPPPPPPLESPLASTVNIDEQPTNSSICEEKQHEVVTQGSSQIHDDGLMETSTTTEADSVALPMHSNMSSEVQLADASSPPPSDDAAVNVPTAPIESSESGEPAQDDHEYIIEPKALIERIPSPDNDDEDNSEDESEEKESKADDEKKKTEQQADASTTDLPVTIVATEPLETVLPPETIPPTSEVTISRADESEEENDEESYENDFNATLPSALPEVVVNQNAGQGEVEQHQQDPMQHEQEQYPIATSSKPLTPLLPKEDDYPQPQQQHSTDIPLEQNHDKLDNIDSSQPLSQPPTEALDRKKSSVKRLSGHDSMEVSAEPVVELMRKKSSSAKRRPTAGEHGNTATAEPTTPPSEALVRKKSNIKRKSSTTNHSTAASSKRSSAGGSGPASAEKTFILAADDSTSQTAVAPTLTTSSSQASVAVTAVTAAVRLSSKKKPTTTPSIKKLPRVPSHDHQSNAALTESGERTASSITVAPLLSPTPSSLSNHSHITKPTPSSIALAAEREARQQAAAEQAAQIAAAQAERLIQMQQEYAHRRAMEREYRIRVKKELKEQHSQLNQLYPLPPFQYKPSNPSILPSIHFGIDGLLNGILSDLRSGQLKLLHHQPHWNSRSIDQERLEKQRKRKRCERITRLMKVQEKQKVVEEEEEEERRMRDAVAASSFQSNNPDSPDASSTFLHSTSSTSTSSTSTSTKPHTHTLLRGLPQTHLHRELSYLKHEYESAPGGYVRAGKSFAPHAVIDENHNVADSTDPSSTAHTNDPHTLIANTMYDDLHRLREASRLRDENIALRKLTDIRREEQRKKKAVRQAEIEAERALFSSEERDRVEAHRQHVREVQEKEARERRKKREEEKAKMAALLYSVNKEKEKDTSLPPSKSVIKPLYIKLREQYHANILLPLEAEAARIKKEKHERLNSFDLEKIQKDAKELYQKEKEVTMKMVAQQHQQHHNTHHPTSSHHSNTHPHGSENVHPSATSDPHTKSNSKDDAASIVAHHTKQKSKGDAGLKGSHLQQVAGAQPQQPQQQPHQRVLKHAVSLPALQTTPTVPAASTSNTPASSTSISEEAGPAINEANPTAVPPPAGKKSLKKLDVTPMTPNASASPAVVKSSPSAAASTKKPSPHLKTPIIPHPKSPAPLEPITTVKKSLPTVIASAEVEITVASPLVASPTHVAAASSPAAKKTHMVPSLSSPVLATATAKSSPAAVTEDKKKPVATAVVAAKPASTKKPTASVPPLKEDAKAKASSKATTKGAVPAAEKGVKNAPAASKVQTVGKETAESSNSTKKKATVMAVVDPVVPADEKKSQEKQEASVEIKSSSLPVDERKKEVEKTVDVVPVVANAGSPPVADAPIAEIAKPTPATVEPTATPSSISTTLAPTVIEADSNTKVTPPTVAIATSMLLTTAPPPVDTNLSSSVTPPLPPQSTTMHEVTVTPTTVATATTVAAIDSVSVTESTLDTPNTITADSKSTKKEADSSLVAAEPISALPTTVTAEQTASAADAVTTAEDSKPTEEESYADETYDDEDSTATVVPVSIAAAQIEDKADSSIPAPTSSQAIEVTASSSTATSSDKVKDTPLAAPPATDSSLPSWLRPIPVRAAGTVTRDED